MHANTLRTIMAALLMAGVFFATAATAQAGTLPNLAASIADELDAQLAQRLNVGERPVRGLAMLVTTPVSLDNLEESSTLGRLIAEECATWFVSVGYKVQEMRKSRMILFAPGKGELLLSRRSNLLEMQNIDASIILSGTYTITSKHVRFNMKLLHAASNEVLAMASATLPMTAEVREMLLGSGGVNFSGIEPSVSTRLNDPFNGF